MGFWESIVDNHLTIAIKRVSPLSPDVGCRRRVSGVSASRVGYRRRMSGVSASYVGCRRRMRGSEAAPFVSRRLQQARSLEAPGANARVGAKVTEFQ